MAILPLTINGKQIRQLEALRENFDLVSVLEYYKNGKLLKWLQDRFYESEAAALESLDETAPDFAQQLCAIFGVEYSGEEINMEDIAQKQERLAKLRTYTDDAEVINNIALVAFDQEELAELLHSGTEKIYLCGDSFVVPASQKNKCYIGVNNPNVHISGEIPENWVEQGIEFVGCTVDNLPEAIPANKGTKGSANPIGIDVSEELVDEIIRRDYNADVIETENYIVLGHCERFYRVDKKTHQWLGVHLAGSCACRTDHMHWGYRDCKWYTVVKDVIYFMDSNPKAPGLYAFDVAALTSLPQRVLSGCFHDASICGHNMALISKDSVCLLDLNTRKCKQLVSGLWVDAGVLANENGVYYTYQDSKDDKKYIAFYDYIEKKVTKRFYSFYDTQLFFAANEGIVIRTGREYGKLPLVAVLENKSVPSSKNEHFSLSGLFQPSDGFKAVIDGFEREKYDIDVMIKGATKDTSIQFYGTQMLFVAQDRTLKYADLSSGEVKTLAPNAMFNGYDGNEPTSFSRIGNWVYFKDYNSASDIARWRGAGEPNWQAKMYKCNISNPDEIEVIETYENAVREQKCNEIETVTLET